MDTICLTLVYQGWYTKLKMTKIAADNTTNDELANNARRAFLMGLFDIGWRMATAFFVPIIAGVIADRQKSSGQTFTIVGVVVGVILAISVIIKLAFDINKVGK